MVENTDQKKQITFKVVTIGDSGVGKTALIMRYVLDVYQPTIKATVGVHCLSKSVTCNGQEVVLQIWDTAGQERHYNALPPSYSRNADAILLCYDITKKGGLETAQKRIDDYTKPDNAIVILVGCKSDLEEKRVISIEKAKKLHLSFFEVSAKNNTNVDELFNYLSSQLSGKTPNRQIFNAQEERATFNIENLTPNKKCRC